MPQPVTCPHCGETVESADDLEAEEASEMKVGADGSVEVYENKRTFYRCRSCRNAMGVGHS